MSPSSLRSAVGDVLKEAGTDRSNVVVVGNGMVSHRFCERLAEYDRERRFRVVVVGEEPRPAYDRVRLTTYFSEPSADALLLGSHGWYEERGIELRVGRRVMSVDRAGRTVLTDDGEELRYDVLVLATGSAPLVPPVPGITKRGVFVYRTIEDLEAILAYSKQARRAAVIGGGLLGLEAARAVLDAGLATHVVEVAPRLMPRQLDEAASALLEQTIRELGVEVHVDKRITKIRGDDAVTGIEFLNGEALDADMVIVSAGIRPRDELARTAGIEVGPRGGVVVDDRLQTSDERVFAVGEVALHRDTIHGLVAPGYEMADALARNLTGADAVFAGADSSAKLKLLGTDVATFGKPFQDPARTRVICTEDQVRRRYTKLVFTGDGRQLLGGILVGDGASYGTLLHLTRSRTELSESLEELGLGGGSPAAARALPDDAQVCSCNNVLARTIRLKIAENDLTTVDAVKSCTRAGTGCGGCLPVVSDVLQAELEARGRAVKPRLCEHFAFTRQELFQIVASRRLRTFADVLAQHGAGHGCEICKPAVASILASLYAEPILEKRHRTLQDTNDRFLANIQKNGTYSIVPRVAGGEITPDQLIVLGQVAKKYGLYTKITGGQRVDLFGARVEELPAIWEELIAAGFESGHAYGKALRTVKSCVGSTWCRYGVQDSTALAVRIENRYKGIRSPHKLKGAVSGCVRECAEAQGKDFGLIATEKGWNVYVCGNGGATPRHADLLVSDVDEETAVRLLDRFLMFYIRTADRLMRTSVWLVKMEGGIEALRRVVVDDSLGIAADLERDMEQLVGAYACEWKDAVEDPVKRATFRHFANDARGDDTIRFAPERGQTKPNTADKTPDPIAAVRHLPILKREWVRVASVRDVPDEGGIAVRWGHLQLAVFQLTSRGEWYATQNVCPHKREMVLARGIVGDQAGAPKVACPLHKKTFDLRTGACLSGDPLEIATFPVRVDGDHVFVELPPVELLEAAPVSCNSACASSLPVALVPQAVMARP
ncbi:MAG TPA: nitrite reductase large subunit NirB [Polyangiaceae bacterium]|nr:nitrite reductase large subunit NirB [Polyangiaceae bacterium]